MTDFPDLGPAAERVAGIAVGALLGHVLSLADAFRGAAAKEPDPGPPPAVPPALPDDWRSALPARLSALAAA